MSAGMSQGVYAVATWVYRLHEAGVRATDAEVAGLCDAIAAATDATAGNAAGDALTARIAALVADAEPAAVARAATALFGARATSALGSGSRDERVARIRKQQFVSGYPWLARVWERADGAVRPTWLVVERVSDLVQAMDPNPWNDVDEARHLPVGDFQVLWELDGCTSVSLTHGA